MANQKDTKLIRVATTSHQSAKLAALKMGVTLQTFVDKAIADAIKKGTSKTK